MTEVSLFRLYLLRATYLFVAVGLGFAIWPQLVHHPTPWSLWHGVGCSLLGAISILALLGVRYPLKLLPVLFAEVIWKVIWLTGVARPLWLSGQMDADNWEVTTSCLMGAIFLVVIPWRYAYATYVKAQGDRWA